MWYEQSQRRILLDLHFPEWDDAILSRFDAKQIVKNFKRAQVDCAMFYTKDHFGNAYYNNKIGHKHRCIGDRDIFGECVAEARKEDLWVIAYYSLLWEKFCVTHHPEWVMKGSNGELFTDGYGHICPNSRYLDYAKGQLKEIIEQYDIDGFWLDINILDIWKSPQVLSCYCDNCQKLFQERTGQKIPTEPTMNKLWGEFLEFRYESTRKFSEEIIRHIKELNSQLSAVCNYHATPSWSWEGGHRPVEHTLFNDYATAEAYPDNFGAVTPSLAPRFLRGLVRNRPYEILTYRFNRSWDYTLKPLNQ